jgi:hypothetical protein
MIKFFRKIRHRLLSENKFNKYLLFAVGEITLVMIGILLALQVNNWNEQRKQNQEIENILLKIYSELQIGLNALGDDMLTLQNGYQSTYKISEAIQNNHPFDNSMILDFWHIKRDEYNLARQTGYEKLKSFGIDKLKNQKLENHLQGIYEQIYPRLSRELEFYPNISTYFSEYYLENFIYNSDMELEIELEIAADTLKFPIKSYNKILEKEVNTTIGYKPIDFEKLKSDPKFYQMLQESQKFRSYKLRQFNSLIKNGNDARELIRNYLKSDSLAIENIITKTQQGI